MYEQGRASGIGLVLVKRDGITAVDLDDCVKEGGELTVEASAYVMRLGSYTEISPSGKGLRFFLQADFKGRRFNKKGKEIYESAQFLTVTGNVIDGRSQIKRRDAEVETIYGEWRRKYGSQSKPKKARSVVGYKFDNNAPITPLDEIGLSEYFLERFKSGEGSAGDDRSAALFGVVIQMIKCGVNRETILTHTTDSNYFLGCVALASHRADGNVESAKRWVWKSVLLKAEGIVKAEIDDEFDILDGPKASSIAPLVKAETDKEFEQLDEPVTNSFSSMVYSASDINADEIPQRDWVYGYDLLTGYLTAVVAPGGTGKSMFSLVVAISVAIGKELLPGKRVPKRRNVLVINNEDDKAELDRRISGICQEYKINSEELQGSLHVISGYEVSVILARIRNNMVDAAPHTNELIEFCIDSEIGLIICDPYVSLHDIPENDNTSQNEVVKVLRSICAQTKVALMIVAHTRKMGSDSEAHAGDAESMRGASAIKDGARIVTTLARMSKTTATKLGIPWETGNTLVRFDDAKKNLSALCDSESWFRLKSVQILSGDTVGVPVPFDIEAARLEHAVEGQVTGPKWAAVIERCLTEELKGCESFKYADVKAPLIASSEFQRSKVEEHVHLLSSDPETPTLVPDERSIIEYWAEKGGTKTAPWIIHRKVVG